MKDDEMVTERAKKLLDRMTLQEKVGQLCQRLYGFQIYEVVDGEIQLSQEFEQEVEAYGGLGTLYGLYRSDPWSGRNYENGLAGEDAIRAYNKVQNYVLTHSRLSIPVMMSSECPHGHQALDGYLLPVNLASGATFSPEILKEAEAVCADQMKRMGVDLALVSMLDILRDPRWGRSEECFGEDPYLASCMAKASVEGMQSHGVGVVAKHFCAQGETTGGVNASAARIGERELAEIHLPAARACCEAGVRGIMAAYNEIDGIYCHANGYLLKDVLRGELGFDGVVMADGVAIDQLDVMTGDNVKSAAVALKAGVQIGLWDTAYSRLGEALDQGLISMEDIDAAVLAVLKLKFEFGLFDTPYIGSDGHRTDRFLEEQKKISLVYSHEEHPQSKRLAEESAVLLKNSEHLLPLCQEGQRIAVIGPNANNIYRQIGDYSPPLAEGTGRTVWQGLTELAGTRILRYSDGSDLSKAQEVASQSDVTILVLGGSSSRFEGAVFDKNGAAIKQSEMQMDCGENVDLSGLCLPAGQQELFDAVRHSTEKLVTVVIAGRPYAIPEIAEETDALLYCFYPGPAGGTAIAELIYGKMSPSGRLSASLPRSAGQLPVYYNYRKSYNAMQYCDGEEGPLYSFGEGFGYSTFSYSDIAVEESMEGLTIRYVVENTGFFRDATVLQCYRSIRDSEVVPRNRELKGFQKVWLNPGERRSMTLELGREFFTIYGIEGKWKEERGCYGILLMDSGRLIWKGAVQH